MLFSKGNYLTPEGYWRVVTHQKNIMFRSVGTFGAIILCFSTSRSYGTISPIPIYLLPTICSYGT
jgi:hypothetical protein